MAKGGTFNNCPRTTGANWDYSMKNWDAQSFSALEKGKERRRGEN
jgi:hypothetical protein